MFYKAICDLVEKLRVVTKDEEILESYQKAKKLYEIAEKAVKNQ